MSAPIAVGVVGTGVISADYLRTLTESDEVTVVAVGDLDVDRARAVAEAFGIPRAGTAASVIGDPRLEIVVNLTPPAAHAEVTLAAIAHDKHVWSEKPIALSEDDADAIVAAAGAAGVLVGVAPDTLLGGAFRTAAGALARGEFGTPFTAQAAFQYVGPDWWPPNPDFLFARGAGPVMDMGPYYVTALARVFGPAVDVVAAGQRPQAVRTVCTGPRAGEKFPVEVDTTVSAIVRYRSGAHAHLSFSFDSPLRRFGILEVTTTEATVTLPDPNRFDGVTTVLRAGEQDATELPSPTPAESRGLGVLSIVRALRDGTPLAASTELARHVLETPLAIEESARTGSRVELHTSFTTPTSVPRPTPGAAHAREGV